MASQQTGNNIESIINESVDKFSNGVISTQKNAYNEILALLSTLEIKNGNVSRTVSNIRTVRKINRTIESKILTDSYRSRVASYLKSFGKVEKESIAYFQAFDKFNKDKTIYSLIKEESLLTTQNQLLEAGINSNFTNPIKEILDRNVKGGAAFGDMVEEIRIFTLGNSNLDGALLRYSKQITSDSLHVYSGVYNNAVGEDLGLEWYRFTGGVIDTTRDFCKSRAGGYFHKSEIQNWADLNWQGKAGGTNSSSIFHYVGGYNCRHTLIPVDSSVVPKKDLERL